MEEEIDDENLEIEEEINDENLETEESVDYEYLPDFQWQNMEILEKFTTKLEETKYKEYKNVKKRLKIENICEKYELFFKHDSNNHYINEKEKYNLFFELFTNLSESEENVKKIKIVMKCLYNTPMFFNQSKVNMIHKIFTNLLKFTESNDDEIFVHSLKCIQVVFITSNVSKYKIDSIIILNIFKRVLEVLKNINENNVESIWETDQEAEHQDNNLETNESNSVKSTKSKKQYNLKKYFQSNTQVALYMPFHAIVLFHSMIPLLSNTDLFWDSKIFKNIFCCDWIFDFVFRDKYNSVEINNFAASLLNRLAESPDFQEFILHLDYISTLIKLPNDTEAAVSIRALILKLSKDKKIMKYFKSVSNDHITEIVYFMLNGISSTVDDDLFQFVENVKKYPKIAQIFNDIKLTEKIIDKVKNMDLITSSTDSLRDIVWLDSHANFFSGFAKYLASEIHHEYCRYFKQINGSELTFSDTIESLVRISNIFNETGGIKQDLELAKYWDEHNVFQLLLYICQEFCSDQRYNEIFELRENIFSLLYALSNYKKTAQLIITCRGEHIFSSDIVNNFFSTFQHVLTVIINENQPTNIPIFEILVSLIQIQMPSIDLLSTESMTYFYSGTHENFDIFNIILKKDLIQLIMKCATKGSYSESQFNFNFHALKALFYLSFNRNACQIISQLEKFFQTKLKLKIKQLSRSNCHKNLICEYIKYIDHLTFRVNLNFFKTYCFYTNNDTKDRKNEYKPVTDFDDDRMLGTTGGFVNFTNISSEETTIDEVLQDNKWKYICDVGINSYIRFDHLLNDGRDVEYSEHCILKNIINTKINIGFHKYKTRQNIMRSFFSTRKLVYLNQSFPNIILNCLEYLKNDEIAIGLKTLIICYDNKNFSEMNRYSIPCKVYYINNSTDGNMLVAGRYDSYIINRSSYLNEEQVQLMIPDLHDCKFTHDDKYVIGINGKFKAAIFDIGANQILRLFSNPDIYSYDLFSPIDINKTDQILLSHSDLYCIRSGKMIHSFENKNKYINGIISHNENEIIIDSQLWDMRTFKLIENNDHLKNKLLRKNVNEKYYYAYNVYPANDDIYIRSSSMQKYSKLENVECIYFYDSNNISCVGKSNEFTSRVSSLSISKDFTQYTINISDNTLDDTSFAVYDIVNPSYQYCREEYYEYENYPQNYIYDETYPSSENSN